MSGTLPLADQIREVNVESRDPTLVDVTQSGRMQVRKVSGQRWVLRVRWRRMRDHLARSLFAFLAAQRGQFETFDVVAPAFSDTRGVGGSPLVAGANQSGTTLNVDGFAPNTAGVMLAGDVFRLAHGKVYMLTADADSAATGAATLQFVPSLVATPADNEALTINQVPFTVRLATDSVSYQLTGRIYEISADFIEDVL